MQSENGLNPRLAWPLIAFGFAGIALAAATFILSVFVHSIDPNGFVRVLGNAFLGYMSLITGLDLRRRQS